MLVVGVSAWLVGCSSLPGAGENRSSGTAPPDPEAELRALVETSDEAMLRLDPQGALARGDARFANRFGDYISKEYFAQMEALARADMEGLKRIPRPALSGPSGIVYDAFRYRTELALRRFDSGAAEILRHLPLDHLFGYHVAFPEWSTGQSIAPFKTLEDYENGVQRIDGFVTYLERAQAVLREAVDAGHVLPRFAAELVLRQVEETLETGLDGSPFLRPIESLPDDLTPVDQRRLKTAYRQAIAEEVIPAYQRLAHFLRQEYLPRSRTGAPGLVGMTDGAILYEYLVELHTGSRQTPEEIHQLGLREVARILAAMEDIKVQVGFTGTLQEFFAHLREDRTFQFSTKEEMLAANRRIQEQVAAVLPRLFDALPRSPLEVRPVPASLEQTTAGAYYIAGTPDGERPGVFYVNTYDLPSRTNVTLETLFLHEGNPGHHMQASLAQENEALPAFLRFGFDTAYVEGWGLYAESLGPELGLFTDPYQVFGHLDLEMFRALRLVVDTGLHHQGWDREKAVDYMLEHSSLGEVTIRSEVDRYIVWPAQALAYKLGQIQIQGFRAEAEERLGESFRLASFHEQVLGSGVLPLPVLRAKVEHWIEETRHQPQHQGAAP